MSLIHEALRRADEDQCRRDAGAEAPAPPALPPDAPRPAPVRRGRWLVPLAAILVIAAGGASYAVWWGIGAAREKAGLAVRSAVAGLEQAAQTAVAEQVAGATAAELPPAASAVAPATAAPSAGSAAARADGEPAPTEPAPAQDASALADADATATSPPSTADGAAAGTGPDGPAEGDVAAGWTPDLLLKTPPEGPATAGAPGSALFDRMLAVLETAAREAARRQAEAGAGAPNTAALPRPTPGAPPTTGASGPPTKPGDAPETPGKASAGAAPATPPAESKPVIDPSQVKISSIMVGPQGNLAVVNGRPVRVGDTILGATVVAITSRSVEVEKDGRRATIGL